MLETAAKVNRKMKNLIIQIYEIQDPAEAEKLIALGVDHIGSVIVSEKDWKIAGINEAIEQVRMSPASSSLIPLYNSLDSVLRTLDYYQPDIVHFCEALTDHQDIWAFCSRLIELQENVKKTFPQIQIMRSIPIAKTGLEHQVPTLEIAKRFEPTSDYFLTDTLLIEKAGSDPNAQPVQGFVGITGQTCSWHSAAQLVAASKIPVILAGGISPDNVAEGVLQVRPAGIDSCTNTNALDEKGDPIRFKKDMGKVRHLVGAVRNLEKQIQHEGFRGSRFRVK
jgi:phosphoribosylanthranilate isomerase